MDNKKLRKMFVIVLLVIAAVGLAAYQIVPPYRARNAAGQEDLLRLRANIALGDAADEVEKEFEALGSPHLTKYMRDDPGHEELVFQTPLRPTACNWVLRVGLSSERVVYLKIRALDVVYQDDFGPPKGAPPNLPADPEET